MAARPALASGVGELGTESAFSVLARARALERAGRDVIHLEIGEPDFPTRRRTSSRPAARRCARARRTTARAPGCPSCARPRPPSSRARAASRSTPSACSSARAPSRSSSSRSSPPAGPATRSCTPTRASRSTSRRSAGPAPRPCPCRSTRPRTSPSTSTSSAPALGPRTKLVILNSPQNPTGGVVGADGAARRPPSSSSARRAWVLSDEVYSRLLHDGEFASIASVPGMLERTVVLDALSKTYAMTGWRCGYAAVPEALVEPLTRFFVNSTSCVPPFVQLAGVAALQGPQDAVTRDGRRAPRPPRPRRGRAQRAARRLVPDPARGLLRVPERLRGPARRGRPRDAPARRGRRRRPGRARPSAPPAPATCASPTRRRGTTSAARVERMGSFLDGLGGR